VNILFWPFLSGFHWVLGTLIVGYVLWQILKDWPEGIRERQRQDDHLFLKRSGMPDLYQACGDDHCPLPKPHGHPFRTQFTPEQLRSQQEMYSHIKIRKDT
jgi:hypothetical protein